MTLTAQRVGQQVPRLSTIPPSTTTSAADDVIDMARLAGFPLDPWQEWVARAGLGEAAGKWSAFEVALVVPRQCGKSALLEAMILASLFVWQERTVIYSAHRFDTAQETFARLQQTIEASSFAGEVAKVYTANGKESIILRNGCRVKFQSRGRGAGRGFSGDRIIFDEAFNLDASAMAAMIPSMAARSMLADGNPQVWYASSAPLPGSSQLLALRARAQGSDPGKLCYAEWSAEPGSDPSDRATWYAANPALGIRIDEAFVEDEMRALQLEEFCRERLGIIPDGADISSVLPEWAACKGDPAPLVDAGFAALSVWPGQTGASVGFAGLRADDAMQVEVVRDEAGTDWVVAACVAACASTGRPLVVDPKSATAGMLPLLRRAGVELREVSTVEYVGACAALQNDVANRRVVHLGAGALDGAVRGAGVRAVGESWAWSARFSAVNIGPLEAVTLAALAARSPVPVVDESWAY